MPFDNKSIMLEVKHLSKCFSSGIFRTQNTRAVDDVSFEQFEAETLALIGESGSGKSTLGKCLLRLIEPTSGKVYFMGEDILHYKQNVLQSKRPQMQMIFQDADGSLNPRMRINRLLGEPFRINGMDNGAINSQMERLVDMVQLSPDVLKRYPHELSGGQRQRVGIARAIALNPRLIVADEPAASLDLLVQTQILQLMKRLQSQCGTAYLLISHNLKMVKSVADRIAVMYSGRLVEIADAGQLASHAKHPYTKMLLSALSCKSRSTDNKLRVPSKRIFSSSSSLNGCNYASLCPKAHEICYENRPDNLYDGDHFVACHYPD